MVETGEKSELAMKRSFVLKCLGVRSKDLERYREATLKIPCTINIAEASFPEELDLRKA